MIAEKKTPLTSIGNRRRLLQNFCDGFSVFESYTHEHSGHKRKMKRHVELVAVSKIRDQVSGRLDYFGGSICRELLVGFAPAL
jgi:hypothetical protein